ncbi:diguanylate cyclase [Coprothermobacteraceae bacterium]|nr:diguanylate cyclase [Coprothermobacteraceae bacterium]
MSFECLSQEILEQVQKNGFVAVIGPPGTGKTHLLKHLRSTLDNSCYANLHSYMEPLGELFFRIFSLGWEKSSLLGTKGLSVVARYLPQEFTPVPLPKPLTTNPEEDELRELFLTLLAATKMYGIEYILLDGLEPDEVTKDRLGILLKLAHHGLKIIAAASSLDSLHGLPVHKVTLLSDSNQSLVELFVKVLGIDTHTATHLVEASRGNLFNARLLLESGAKSIEEMVAAESRRDPELFHALEWLAHFDTWFSPMSKDIVEAELLDSQRDLLESRLIVAEEPQFRFASREIKDTIASMSKVDSKAAHSWIAAKLAAKWLPNYWRRLANAFGMAGEQRKQVFALVMAARHAPSLKLRASYLKQVLELAPHLDGARRALADAYHSLGEPQRAIETLSDLRDSHPIDRAKLVRYCVTAGKNSDAAKISEELIANLQQVDPMFIPGLLSDMAPYVLTLKEDTELILSKYKELMSSDSSVPRTHWGAFLNAVAIAQERHLKYEVALDLYKKSRDLLSDAPSSELLYRPLINQTSLSTVIEGAKTILESMKLLEGLVPQVSARARQVIWDSLFTSTREFLKRESLNKYKSNLQKTVAQSSNPHYRFEEYMTLARHYLDVMDMALAKWFWKLANAEANLASEHLSLDILQASIELYEKGQPNPSHVRELMHKAMESFPSTADAQQLVALAIASGVNDIPSAVLDLLDDTPYSTALKRLAAETVDPILVARELLKMWRRWERISMSKTAKLILARKESFSPAVLKTLVHWALDTVSSLDYPQLTDFWQRTFNSIAATSEWPWFMRWHFNLLEVKNTEQLKGALEYLLSQFFVDFFARVESGSLSLELGDKRFLALATHTFSRQGVVNIEVHSTTAAETAPLAMELLGFSLEQVNAHLFGLQDPLTGLFNRAYGSYTLQELWELYSRHGAVFSILFLDLDSFKHINDTYGHETGDKVLIAVSHAINASVRNTDVVVRWGGDEFLVILPETPSASLDAIVQRMEQNIANLRVLPAERLRASIGQAGCEEAPSLKHMLDLADKRAYIAKSGHRKEVAN